MWFLLKRTNCFSELRKQSRKNYFLDANNAYFTYAYQIGSITEILIICKKYSYEFHKLHINYPRAVTPKVNSKAALDKIQSPPKENKNSYKKLKENTIFISYSKCSRSRHLICGSNIVENVETLFTNC